MGIEADIQTSHVHKQIDDLEYVDITDQETMAMLFLKGGFL